MGPRSTQFRKLGYPVAPVLPTDGPGILTGSFGLISLMNHPPHPNAAKLYVNWLASRDGQPLFAKAMLAGSLRTDLKQDWMPSFEMTQPGRTLLRRLRLQVHHGRPGRRAGQVQGAARPLRLLALLLVLVALVARADAAESSTATIAGVVTSTQGEPIAGAQVAAGSPSGRYEATTDVRGAFRLLGVLPDTYTISVEAHGFEAAVRAGVTVQPGSGPTMNVRLTPYSRRSARSGRP